MTSAFHVAAIAAVLAAVGWTIVWVRSRNGPAAAYFAFGLGLRTVLGIALFVISWQHLPIFRQLQLGGGFWTLAVDARSYFTAAAVAAERGVSTVSPYSASPMFVKVLALWIDLTGPVPLNGALLNLVCYAATVTFIVSASGCRDGTRLAVAAMTFSPALLVFGTQPLKDTLNVLTIAAAASAVAAMSRSRRVVDSAYGVLTLAAAVFIVAGIRAYFAVLTIGAVLVAGMCAVLTDIVSGRLKTLVTFGIAIPLCWWALALGAGPYYEPYRDVLISVTRDGNAVALVTAFDRARAAFIQTGGGTATVTAEDSVPIEVTSFVDFGIGRIARVKRTVFGLAVMFVPMSALKALGAVNMAGGRGLLIIADLDTLVMDAFLGVAVAFVLFHRSSRSFDAVVAAFGLVLAVVTTVLMAYVVTNFGTLFRLRLLAVTPVLILPAFVIRSQGEGGQEHRVHVRQ